MNNNSIGTYEAAVREIRNKDKREGLKYWKELLDGFDTRTEITSFGEVPVEEQSNETELGIDVDAEVTRKFTELCRSEDTTTGIGVQLVWGMILCTYSRSEDVVFAKVVSGRDNTKEDVNRTIGLFINTVPVRMMITDKSTPREILKSLQEQSVKSSEYDYCALSEIQSVSELGNRLFQTVLTFQNYADTTSHKAENPKRRSFKIKNAVMKEETFDDLTPVAYMNGDCLHLNLRFDKKKYRESEIRTILSLFETFVSGISYEPDRALVTMDRVSEVQKNAIIKMSTGPELSYDSHETWIDMFLSRVAEDPDHIAVTDDKGTLTYRELDKLSDSVAMYLLQQKVEPDEFVVIKMHRYKEFAAAVIGIHKVGACYVPIDPDYPEDRIAFMESDCRARLVLDRELVLECAELFSVPEPVHKTNPENLAYMIYTSGSTGKPKGAMIPHSALMNYTQIYIRRFGVTKEDRLSHHITFSFDSHIRDFYPALASGASLHFMSDDIVKDPALIVTFLNENRITGAAFATAMGQLLLTEYELKLRFVSVGGEALRGVTGSDIHVFNVCGATEVTDVVLDYELEKGRYYDSVPIGKPLENCYAFILDPYGNILPQGIPGEICYAGKNVGNGYWNRDDLTRAAFTDCPVIPGITMYHTRDLGRYNQDGDVEYMGRLDFQVKLRGFRIELGEVESNAIKYPGIKQVVAKVSDDHLYLYYTADERISADRLRDYLSACLAQYMIPDGFLQLDAMPLTPSGKIDKKSLPAIEKKTIEVIPPENELEKELYDIIRGQIGYDDFGVTSNLISQGMTSLGIMRLSSIIQTKFKASVSVAFIMKEPFIRNISEKIKENLSLTKEPLQNLHSYGRREVYPATENQTGVYLDWEMNRNTTQYNIPVAVCLTDVDTKRFADAIKASLTAHSYMNSCFEITDGMVVQIPRNIDDVNIPVTELNNKPDSRFFQALVKPFDLNSDILYRFEMFTFENQTFLFMDVHHIIFDGLSETIFMEDVLKAYEGQVPEAEEVSAYDFSLFEKELQSSSSFEASKAYFNELLSDFNVMSYPDSETPDGTGQGEVTVRVESKVVDRAVKNMEVTAGSFIHAAFGETMGRFIREDNPVYLTISNGRMGIQKLDRTVGMFVKTVPVVYRRKNAPAGNDSVRDYVFSVSEQLKETYKNELYPYTKLVEENGLRGEILFVYQGGMFEGGEVEGASILELKLDTLKFPITITAYPVDNFYEISFEYDGRRYARKDIELLASCLKQVILDMTYEERLCDVHLISSDEEKLIIERSRGAEINFDTTRTWLDYFKEAVFNHSDSLALADEERSLTYRQLDEEAGAVASYLIERGVQKNEFVALCMDRCTEFVIAVVGIHKAGAAYVPVDINYPEERRNYMLSDSEAKVVLTQKLVREALRAYYNTPKESVAAPEVFSKALSDRSPSPDNFAYMIYTSGSTGRPKGTILHHRGLLNFAIATMKENELTSSDRIGHHFSFSFDSHIEDLYPPLISGASIHIMAESVRRDPDLIFDYINRHGITGGGFTTSIGRILATGYLLPQRYIALMGEALTEITPGETTIINKYGPTECTNIVSTYVLEKGRKYREVPIGRPMPNGAVFLLDTRNNLVPYGCIGELCYAGPQTGFGYWKQEKKTEEVFTECPWIEGTKLYHTGDLARYDRNGELIYLGRIDDQVKVNGFRVEFGEIESAALGYAGVLQAAASVKNGRIVLYYTEKGTEKEPDENKLRIKMSETLADYMMPALFVRLDKMPSTPSGKIDRRALPEPAVFRTTPFTEPVTSTQKTVVLCLKKVLGVS
ncbi:MAG: amino acid adenylation domain-containing protein, partial [Oribacterium sp.]|nr:amino acid adenylation domain-containing protein [Oribacterium sp.]